MKLTDNQIVKINKGINIAFYIMAVVNILVAPVYYNFIK